VLNFGELSLDECGVSGTGKCSLDDYEGAMLIAAMTARHAPWWIGDMLNSLDFKYGDKGAQAIPLELLSLEYLERVKGVAKKVPYKNRRADLSWTHHQQASRLPKHMQPEWLERAAKEGWNSNQLRLAISDFVNKK